MATDSDEDFTAYTPNMASEILRPFTPEEWARLTHPAFDWHCSADTPVSELLAQTERALAKESH